MGWRERNRPLGSAYLSDGRFVWCAWHGRKWPRYRWHRHVRTTAELRWGDPEFGRASRNRRHLPSYWDDVLRHVERSWKRQRKTKYWRVMEITNV